MKLWRVSSLTGLTVLATAAVTAAGVLATGGAFASSASPQAAAVAHRHPIRVGSVTIPPCRASRLAWCTRINVPLDLR